MIVCTQTTDHISFCDHPSLSSRRRSSAASLATGNSKRRGGQSGGRLAAAATGGMDRLERRLEVDCGRSPHPASTQPCNDIASRTGATALCVRWRWTEPACLRCPSSTLTLYRSTPGLSPSAYTTQTVYIRNSDCMYIRLENAQQTSGAWAMRWLNKQFLVLISLHEPTL